MYLELEPQKWLTSILPSCGANSPKSDAQTPSKMQREHLTLMTEISKKQLSEELYKLAERQKKERFRLGS